MNTQNKNLAAALETLRKLQEKGLHAIHGTALPRVQREALLRAGFLKQVMRRWYIPSRPDAAEGDSTAWHASMREFVAGYAQERFGDRWHVNPELSLLLRSGERTVPQQIQIWASEGNNQTVSLLHGCSLFLYRASTLLPSSQVRDCGGLRLAELADALVAASPTVFVQWPMAAHIALASLPDAAEVLRILLDGSHSAVAGRLAGAFRAAGRGALADEILGAMRAAGYAVNEVDPFQKSLPGPLPDPRGDS